MKVFHIVVLWRDRLWTDEEIRVDATDNHTNDEAAARQALTSLLKDRARGFVGLGPVLRWHKLQAGEGY